MRNPEALPDPVPWQYGMPSGEPGVYLLGADGWLERWSPHAIHPYAAKWLEWAIRSGPSPALAPPQPDFAFYALYVADISD